MSALSKVKIISGLFTQNTELFKEARISLERMLGPVDYESDLLDFSHTDYYREEMGDRLKRKILSFNKLRSPDNIHSIKVKTNRLEKAFSSAGKRNINIDPGYMDLGKLVLFSTKDYSHRVYLGGGIFGEVTLFYKDKTFNGWPWTYPDYGSSRYIMIFNSIRDIYKNQLKRP